VTGATIGDGWVEVEWVERLLVQWAEWSATHGQGSGALVLRYVPREGDRGVPINDTVFDALMLDVDRAVAGLMAVLREVVLMEYVQGHQLTQVHRAGRCHCSVQTYARRLRVALEALAETLGRRR